MSEDRRLTYGSLVVMFLVAALFLSALPLLLEAVLAPLESLASAPVYSPALARLYAAVRSFYLTLRYALTNPAPLAVLLAASLILAAFEVTRERD